MDAKKQIKSRQRVEDHGEVFTSEREVNAMLDLVNQEFENIDSRFLEPACGTGNFLSEILRRKLVIVRKKYKEKQNDYEKYAFIAVSSIYGIDILEDNVRECRERLKTQFYNEYYSLFKNNCNDRYMNSIRFLLHKNIICGDALSLKRKIITSNNEVKEVPIIFSYWSIVTEDKVKRKDYSYEEILDGHNNQASLSCFATGAKYDEENKAFIPAPVAEYPSISYMELANYD